MSLTIMIFVNYGGGGYWFFDHSKWNGLTVADLVFPWFVWIMGVSLVFSFHGRRRDSFLRQLFQILRRTVILFAVGLFLNTSEGTVACSGMLLCLWVAMYHAWVAKGWHKPYPLVGFKQNCCLSEHCIV